MLEFTLQHEDYAKHIKLEHSLVAVSKWESVYQIPFFSISTFKPEQFIFYVECMLIDCELTDYDYSLLTVDHINMIQGYMNDKRTATYVRPSDKPSTTTLTSEIIYANMAGTGVDWSCENWHLNRLLKLLEVISAMSEEKKPMTQQEIMEERIRLNQERRKKYQSKG